MSIQYFTTFARRSLDSYEFKANLLAFFASDSSASSALESVDWDAWFYKPGFPPKPDFDTSLVDVCYDLASKWQKNKDSETFKPQAADIEGWTANQLVVFLDSILSIAHPLDKSETQTMGSIYGLAKSGNVEVVSRYFQVALRARNEAAYQPTADLLGRIGRMKFVRPL